MMAIHASGRDRVAFSLHDLADVVFELTAEPRGSQYEHTLFLEKVANRPDLSHVWRAVMGENGWHVEDRGAPSG